jgi:hypothetical protein
MSDVSIDQLGPVDYLVVEFPANASNFTGEMLKELTALVEGGTIRVIDMLILKKDADGGIDVVELEDLMSSANCRPSRPSSPKCWPRTTSSTSLRRWSREALQAC